MRLSLLGLLLVVPPAVAVERIELSIGRVSAGAEQELRAVAVDWRPRDGTLHAAATVHHPQLPEPLRVQSSCGALRGDERGLRCADALLRISGDTVGHLDARFNAAQQSSGDWHVQLHQADAVLNYNSEDGRFAAENLQLRVNGDAAYAASGWTGALRLQAQGGQAYAEPVFFDLAAQPLKAELAVAARDGILHVQQLALAQDGIGELQIQGTAVAADWTQQHRLDLSVEVVDGSAATAVYLQPLLAATPLQNTRLEGRLRATAALTDRRVETAAVDLQAVALDAPGFGLALSGIDGSARWHEAAPAPDSTLRWQGGSVGRVPIGGAELRFAASGRDFALRAPLSLPILDGGLDVARLVLRGIGNDDMAADFAADLRPIELRQLCRALGWPEFSGTLSGRLPGLHLEDRRLSLDGVLTATAFDGEIELSELTVIDPLGVLPRIRADLRLRRLDLAALTGAFDFGRITGRLDGDVIGLRLIGWAPVAMNARLYTTPGDRSRRRISQRAIDNISSVGGGPTGILSRGFMRFFDDFAYRRIGWSCVLDNGICRMDGVTPHRDGQGYVIVQGSGLPRIDVVGYSRRVSWRVFLSQLKSIGNSGPVEVRGR